MYKLIGGLLFLAQTSWALVGGSASVTVQSGQIVINPLDKVILSVAGCNNATASPTLDLPTANAAGTACLGTTTTSGVLTYADGATTGATFHFRLPSDWIASGEDIALLYTGSSSSTNNIRWQVSTACVADGEDLIAPSYNATSASNVAGPTTAGQRKGTTFASVAVTNCAAGETQFIKIERIGADAGDTYTGVGHLFELDVSLRRAE